MMNILFLFAFLALGASPADEGPIVGCAEKTKRLLKSIEDSSNQYKGYFSTVNAFRERWPADGDSAAGNRDVYTSYNYRFQGLLGKSIEEALSERKAQGKSTHVMDLFGSAMFLDNAESTDSLTGVRLMPLATDPREKTLIEKYKGKHAEVFGNLYDGKTWTAVNDSMKSRNIPSFDLIIMRPWGALSNLEAQSKRDNLYPEFESEYCNLIVKAYERVSPNGGELLVEMPGERDEKGHFQEFTPRLRSWLNKLQDSGVAVLRNSYGSVRITRQPTSPAQLLPLVSN